MSSKNDVLLRSIIYDNIFQKDRDSDFLPFLTMKFLSQKQEESAENLQDFEKKYGVVFRNYELISSITEEYKNNKESSLSNFKSALNGLKNSQNKQIRKVFSQVSHKIDNEFFEDIMKLLSIDEDIKKMCLIINRLQNSRTRFRRLPFTSNIKVLAEFAATNHKTKNIYFPVGTDVEIINFLDDFEHLTINEEDKQEYYHTIENLIINEVPPEQVTINNEEKIIDDTEDKYDTIISLPLKPKQSKITFYFESHRYSKYNKNPHIIYFLNLIDHLDEGGILVTKTTHDLLVSNDTYEIRKILIENNILDTAIEYSSRLNSDDLILIINKNKKTNDFLFIKPEEPIPRFISPNVDKKILETYKNRESVPKFSSIVSKEDILSNDYNLNIKRYVYTLEYEERPISEIIEEQERYADEIRQLDTEICELLK